ncbi:HD domain-containing protein [Flavobacteriaceae bacterium MAR_2010_188]|nr:HD domain-containing protein [Flavobacteriaceae bacterium MAR_2010_188]
MVLKNIGAYPQVCFEILADLEEKLPDHLEYHCLEHTLDVANICEFYIKYFDLPKDQADLLRIAAIGHDYGYIESPTEHERNSVDKLRPLLEKHGYSEDDIEMIGGMIMATKIPQTPKNFFEEILADADLDYLGRKDYDKLSSRLLQEFFHYNVVKNQREWLDAQINFLENHKYHTEIAQEKRNKSKFEKLKQLKGERLAYNGN